MSINLISTIFEKLPASGEKCLIIGPQEALIYPFGSAFANWTKIRIGMFLSATSISSDNYFYNSESTRLSSGINQLFLGIKDSSETIPFFENFTGTIIGGGSFGSNVDLNSSNGQIGALTAFCGSGHDYILTNGNGFGNFANIAIAGIVDCTGNLSFARMVGLEISIYNRGQTNQAVGIASFYNGNNTNDTSTTNLRSWMANPFFNTNSTGFFTQGFVEGGSPFPIPDSVFFYSPFKNSRFRIHNLVVEKYA